MTSYLNVLILMVAMSAAAAAQTVAPSLRPGTSERPQVARNDSAALSDREARSRASVPSSPVETYLVGPGDLIGISINGIELPRKAYPVRGDGTIDFTLGGQAAAAAGLTADEIAAQIARSVMILKDPVVEVRVLGYGSHTVEVFGEVDSPGVKTLQREAVPLYVLLAEAGTRGSIGCIALIRGDGSQVQLVGDASSTLIYAGDRVEVGCRSEDKPKALLPENR